MPLTAPPEFLWLRGDDEEEEEERWGRGGRREGELVFRRVGGRVAEAEAIKARLPDRGAHLGRGADREG